MKSLGERTGAEMNGNVPSYKTKIWTFLDTCKVSDLRIYSVDSSLEGKGFKSELMRNILERVCHSSVEDGLWCTIDSALGMNPLKGQKDYLLWLQASTCRILSKEDPSRSENFQQRKKVALFLSILLQMNSLAMSYRSRLMTSYVKRYW